jgi:DNA-binding response OmpR family regulator
MSSKILIIEDELAIAKALQMKLTDAGLVVDLATNGRSGLEALQKDNYDLIILDLMMPEMDGWSVLSNMRQAGINTPVIVASNLSQAEDIDKAKQMGAVDFIVKSETSLAEIAARITLQLSR